MAKLVTLDVTNTIIKVAVSVGHQYSKIARKHGVFVGPAKLDQSFKRVFKDHLEKHPNFGVSEGERSGRKWWTRVVEQTFRLAGCEINNKQFRSINDELYDYFKTAEPWEILPGSLETLTCLNSVKQHRPFTIGVISNNTEALETVLTSLGIIDKFDFVLSSVLENCSKPDSQIFKKALQIAGVDARQAIHVGDSVQNDYHGARGVGMKALLLAADVKRVPSDVDAGDVISSLDKVLDFL